MSLTLSSELLAQLFAQESDDPFLLLVTLSHPDFVDDIRLVNNTVNIVSRGDTFLAFPFRTRFPVDDGQTKREFSIEFDNVSLDLIEGIRTVTDPIDVKIEMILASLPDEVQMSQEELKIRQVVYDQNRVTATIALDDFLNTEMTSEKYTPTNFPGIF